MINSSPEWIFERFHCSKPRTHLRLRAWLVKHKPLCYTGMMAGKSKARQILSQLEARGAPREMLNQTHPPIGLRIGSRTPEEIAVSIAAEIIKVRRGHGSIRPAI